MLLHLRLEGELGRVECGKQPLPSQESERGASTEQQKEGPGKQGLETAGLPTLQLLPKTCSEHFAQQRAVKSWEMFSSRKQPSARMESIWRKKIADSSYSNVVFSISNLPSTLQFGWMLCHFSPPPPGYAKSSQANNFRFQRGSWGRSPSLLPKCSL